MGLRISREVMVNASAHFLKMSKENAAKSDSEKRLYSIAAEVEVKPNVWKPEIAEVFATDRGTALASYFVSQPYRVRIVGCAPTLGFWVEDKDGKVLSTR